MASWSNTPTDDDRIGCTIVRRRIQRCRIRADRGVRSGFVRHDETVGRGSAELACPGISAEVADEIADKRAQVGGFSSADDLGQCSTCRPFVVEQIRNLVICIAIQPTGHSGLFIRRSNDPARCLRNLRGAQSVVGGEQAADQAQGDHHRGWR